MSKKKIAYLTHGVRNIGGGEYALYSLIKNLRRDIFEPVVFYSHENEIIKRLREDGVQLVNVVLNEKITSVYRDEIKGGPLAFLTYARYLIEGILRVRTLLKKYEIDMLHPHDNLSKIIGGFAMRTSGGKVVAHCHDLLRESFIDSFLKFYQLIFMNRIIAVSESARKTFSVLGKIPDKVSVIHNGIDMSIYNCEIKPPVLKKVVIEEGCVVLGIIAVFDECKGHLHLFEAISKMVAAGISGFVCLVIGDGREREGLAEFVRARGLEKHIIFLGYRNDIAELLTIIDIVVVPSLKESFGMTALEAMAMKVPVVATNVGGLPEIIDNNVTGILVPPGDANSLSRAIVALMNNDELRKKMGVAGRLNVENKFSLENNVRKTEEIYLNVLKAD